MLYVYRKVSNSSAESEIGLRFHRRRKRLKFPLFIRDYRNEHPGMSSFKFRRGPFLRLCLIDDA